MLKRALFILVTFATMIFLGVFVALNSHKVTYNYWIGQYETYAFMPFLAGFVLGVLGVFLFFVTSGYLWKSRALSLEKQLHDLHKNQQKKEIRAQFEEVKHTQPTA